MRKTLGRAALVKVEYGKWGTEVLFQDGLAERGAMNGKLVDVGLHEQHLFGIEILQVLVEHLGRQSVIEGHPPVVVAGQDFGSQASGLGLMGYRLQIGRIRRACFKWRSLRRRRQDEQ